MTIPNRSTSEAINGVEDTAGSRPMRSSKIGSIAPTTLPKVTTAISVTPKTWSEAITVAARASEKTPSTVRSGTPYAPATS